jgi:hypothetical protein
MLKYVSLGLLSVVCLTGCGSSTTVEKQAPSAAKEHDHDHEHPSEGPHHGQLIELGKEEYHAELTMDEIEHVVTVFLLDSAAKKAVGSDAKVITINLMVDGKPAQFTLPAKPQAEDKEGQASRYELADEALAHGLEGKEPKGRINIAVGGKDYTGEIGPIEHHDHDTNNAAKASSSF